MGAGNMETIQLAISDRPYATALRAALLRNGPWQVSCVDKPNPDDPGVMVLDTVTLEQVARPIANPERVVLITRNDPGHLSDAWDAGILSVVFEKDPISTAMLAIMSARLRVPRPKPPQVRSKPVSAGSVEPEPVHTAKSGSGRERS